MKKFLILAVLSLGLTLHLPPALAQQKPSEPMQKDVGKLRERIDNYKMWKLTEELELNDETAARLFPVMKQYTDEKFKLERQMRKDIRDLRTTLQNGDDAALSAIISRIEDNHHKLQRLSDEEMGKIKGILTVRQHATFIIFKMDFDSRIQQFIVEKRVKPKTLKEKKTPSGQVEEAPQE